MNQLVMSIRKEIWEFNKTLFWLPVGMLVLFLVLQLFSSFYSGQNLLPQLTSQVDVAENIPQINVIVQGILLATYIPFLLAAVVVCLFYFLSCLYDERRDLSVMFWRSMPVSDVKTIASKWLMGAVVIPLIYVGFGSILYVFSAAYLLISGSIVLSAEMPSVFELIPVGDVILNFVALLGLILVVALWTLPYVTYLMLASAIATRAPILWAALPIAILLIAESVLVGNGVLDRHYLLNMFGNYAIDPDGAAIAANDIEMNRRAWFMLFLEKISVWSIALSGLFLVAAYWCRTKFRTT